MAGKPLMIEQILTLLAAATPRIATFTDGLAPSAIALAPASDEWSANDVLAHLRSCSDVWGGCMATILAENGPTIRAVNPTAWIKKTNYLELAFQPSFGAFVTQRADLLAVLEPLPQESWLRAATVTGAGKPLKKTVLSYAERLATHERSHVKQIGRIANTMRARV